MGAGRRMFRVMTRREGVGVVGAGPAGARAAELLAERGVDVVLLDPRAPWEKPCGGGLTWSAFAALPELSEILPNARTIEWMRIELGPERGFRVRLDRPLRIVPRETLGRWQLERAVRAGAQHVAAKVDSIRRTPTGWSLRTGAGEVRCSFLVGADGAASLVRRVAAPAFRVELAPTRVSYPAWVGPDTDTVVVRFYDSVAGYLWDFPRLHHRSVGVGVPNRTWPRTALDAEIDRYRDAGRSCSCSPPRRIGTVIGTAQLGHGDFGAVAGADFALVGDAAGFADPLTGEGIVNAMRSATLLAKAWEGGRADSYPSLSRRSFAREFAVSRAIRRYVLESALGLRWIEAALASPLPYAGLVALLNAVDEHDGRVARLLRRASGTWRRARKAPEITGRGPRAPVPCRCEGGGNDAASGRIGRAPSPTG